MDLRRRSEGKEQPRNHFTRQGTCLAPTATPEFKKGQADYGDDKVHGHWPLYEKGRVEKCRLKLEIRKLTLGSVISAAGSPVPELVKHGAGREEAGFLGSLPDHGGRIVWEQTQGRDQ